MALRLRDNAPDGRGILPDDKSRGVVVATTAIATWSVILSDMVGGALAVVAVAKEGEYFGEYRLPEHTLMLLCQSARNVTVLRVLPVSDWLKVLQVMASSVPGNEEAGMLRAVRIENGVSQKGVISLSPPRGKLTGNAGAMVAWAAELPAGGGVGRQRQTVRPGGAGRAWRDPG